MHRCSTPPPSPLPLSQLSFLSQDTQGKSYVFMAIPIVFSVLRQARWVLCICGYSIVFSVPRYARTNAVFCVPRHARQVLHVYGYSNCLFCPKTRQVGPVYLWLFHLSFLSQDTPGKSCVLIAILIVFSVPRHTRINVIPIVFSVPRHARQVLCTYIATSIPYPFVFFIPAHSKQVVSTHIVASIPVLIVLSVLKYSRLVQCTHTCNHFTPKSKCSFQSQRVQGKSCIVIATF